MVADTGATPRPSGIRPLDAPQLVQVDVGEDGIPTAVRLKPVLSSGRRSRVSTASDLSNAPVLGPSSLPRCPSPPAPLPEGEGRPKAGVRGIGDYSAGENQHERFHGRTKGRWRKVLEILDTWRIDDEWWRKQPVSRLYYRVVLEDGTMAGLFKDLIGGQWYQQRV